MRVGDRRRNHWIGRRRFKEGQNCRYQLLLEDSRRAFSRDLIGRLSQSLNAFAPVADDEYYVSKVGLARPFQAKGLAKILVEHCLDQGTTLGYCKFRADIETENKPSLRCSRATGFEIFYTGQSADGALKYHALRYERKNK